MATPDFKIVNTPLLPQNPPMIDGETRVQYRERLAVYQAINMINSKIEWLAAAMGVEFPNGAK